MAQNKRLIDLNKDKFIYFEQILCFHEFRYRGLELYELNIGKIDKAGLETVPVNSQRSIETYGMR